MNGKCIIFCILHQGRLQRQRRYLLCQRFRLVVPFSRLKHLGHCKVLTKLLPINLELQVLKSVLFISKVDTFEGGLNIYKPVLIALADG